MAVGESYRTQVSVCLFCKSKPFSWTDSSFVFDMDFWVLDVSKGISNEKKFMMIAEIKALLCLPALDQYIGFFLYWDEEANVLV